MSCGYGSYGDRWHPWLCLGGADEDLRAAVPARPLARRPRRALDDARDSRTAARSQAVQAPPRGPAGDREQPARRDTFEFHVGDEVFHFQVRHGRFLPRSGPSPTDPTVRIAFDLQTFMDLALRQLTPSQALKDGRARILAGSRSSLAEVFRVL